MGHVVVVMTGHLCQTGKTLNLRSHAVKLKLTGTELATSVSH